MGRRSEALALALPTEQKPLVLQWGLGYTAASIRACKADAATVGGRRGGDQALSACVAIPGSFTGL